MTGRRSRYLLQEEMESRYFGLYQFLGGYLHEDWRLESASPEAAIDKAIADGPVEILQQMRRQMNAILSETDDDTRLCDILNDGLGVNIRFKKPAEARAFAELVERKLLHAIQTHFDGSRLKG